MSDRVESRDAPAGRIALMLAMLIGALLLVCAAVAGLLASFDGHSPPEAPPPPAALVPPEPRLQADEPRQRGALERAAEARLRAAPGHIGIDEAMRRVERQGWGPRP